LYRSPATPPGDGRLVTVRRYLDPLAAQLARTHLSAEGIHAYVIEAASFNPLLTGAAGGVQLQVSERDVERVEAILEASAPGASTAIDDEEGPGAVRCPECELAYCFHQRPRVRTSSLLSLAVLVAIPAVIFGPKRWHCHKCGHVWDDPKEGPAEITRLEPGDPRPVFRLRRAHGGMGLFIGLSAGFLGGVVAGPGLGLAVALGAILVGWLVGRSLRYDVCSEPECRAPLPSDAEDCARCKGSVAGVIRGAEKHFSAAADFRRELAALRPKPKKKGKASARNKASAAVL
jgi:hypothetical protein